ncbi:hypothetical protein Pfo_015113, partial [Paulownia fortunei]
PPPPPSKKPIPKTIHIFCLEFLAQKSSHNHTCIRISLIMANPKLLHSLISILLLFSLVIFQLASARPLEDGATLYPAGLTKIFPGEQNEGNSLERNSGITPSHDDEIKKVFQANNHRKLGLAFGPSLMNMLPKGRIPASGPSRRINNANN